MIQMDSILSLSMGLYLLAWPHVSLNRLSLSKLLMDCTMTRTADAVFRIVFACVCYVFVFVIEI